MLNISSPDHNSIISCTAPIAIDHLKKYFNNKNLQFHINYTQSKLQSKKLFTYLSNLDVPSDLVLSDNIGFNEKSELLYEYMTSPIIINLPIFNLAASSIVFRKKGFDLKDAYPVPYFTEEEIDRYIDEYGEIVTRWVTFLDSCTIYAQKCVPELNVEEFLTGGIDIITDRNYVGYSIVNLFSLDFFFHNYYKKSLGTLYYFKPYFEENMFLGKSLFAYFATKHNFLLPMLTVLGKKDHKNDDTD